MTLSKYWLIFIFGWIISLTLTTAEQVWRQNGTFPSNDNAARLDLEELTDVFVSAVASDIQLMNLLSDRHANNSSYSLAKWVYFTAGNSDLKQSRVKTHQPRSSQLMSLSLTDSLTLTSHNTDSLNVQGHLRASRIWCAGTFLFIQCAMLSGTGGVRSV